MVKVHANETVPCDMVLLGTSDPSGVAYVETLNLDGESNLKSRYARQETSNQHPEVGPLTGLIVCKAPDRNIYEFSAYMELPADSQDIQIPLGQNNIILRGCEVKNTSWVVGVVVYAGRETKAMLNSSGAQSKRSKLEHYMNRETGWLVVFLVVICFVGGLGMGLWVAANYDYLNIILYYKKTSSNGGNYLFAGSVGEGIFGFLSCVIRFQIMIPLSLYISMELVRLGQSYFMIRDTEMYDAASNSKFQCRALNINEDLGQIKYLFSDKTGTLTENKMEFHTASIDGVDYSNTKVVIEPATGKIEGSITPEDSRFVEG
jgi:phospholipid-transporting ATPase